MRASVARAPPAGLCSCTDDSTRTALLPWRPTGQKLGSSVCMTRISILHLAKANSAQSDLRIDNTSLNVCCCCPFPELAVAFTVC